MRNSLMLSAVFLFARGMTSLAAVLYVGPGEAYTTIGQAMWDVKDGDTVMIRDGIYDESIDIRSSIMLLAENRHQAIFGDGAGSEGILRIRKSNVIVDGFKFNGNEGGHGIIIMGSDLTPVSNCMIINNEINHRAMGIMVSEYATDCIIDSNIITGCDENGIHHNGKGENTISYNRIQNNGGSGIVISNSFQGTVMIAGDTILQNGDDGIRIFSSGISVQGNVIRENNETGVKVNPGLNNIIINHKNQIKQNGMQGIEIEQGSVVDIDDNLIEGNTQTGIMIDENGSGTISNNFISGNQSSGVENSGAAVMTGNTIRENFSHGVENLGTASKTWLENNRISNNAESGVSLWEAAELKGNVIDSNGLLGVAIAENIDTVFIFGNNEISYNVQHGIYIAPESRVAIRNNQISENGYPDDSQFDICGIFTESPVIIEGNTIENNESAGILATMGATNSMIRNSNQIIGNEVGILLLSPSIVDSNKIQNNKGVGILIRSADCDITHNQISGNGQGIGLDEQASDIIISHCDISNNNSGIVTSGQVKVRKTTIKGNALVGVDISESGIDLGRNNDEEAGLNVIGQNQVCNISNMTPDTIYACRNYWEVSDTAKIDETISDDDEDPMFGPVIFSPFLVQDPTGLGHMLEEVRDPDEMGMDAVYPNPFTNELTISYHLSNPMDVTIRIIDLHGCIIADLIRERHHDPGRYTVLWSSKSEHEIRVPSGVYIVLMMGDEWIQARKVQLVEP